MSFSYRFCCWRMANQNFVNQRGIVSFSTCHHHAVGTSSCSWWCQIPDCTKICFMFWTVSGMGAYHAHAFCTCCGSDVVSDSCDTSCLTHDTPLCHVWFLSSCNWTSWLEVAFPHCRKMFSWKMASSSAGDCCISSALPPSVESIELSSCPVAISFDMCCDLQCRFVLGLDLVQYKTSLNRWWKFHFVLYFWHHAIFSPKDVDGIG